MSKGKINVSVENIFPLIKKFLYSDQEIFLRELISNATDATTKLKHLSNIGEAKIDIKISAADTVSHALYPVPAIQKFDLLINLLKNINFENLIFGRKNKF